MPGTLPNPTEPAAEACRALVPLLLWVLLIVLWTGGLAIHRRTMPDTLPAVTTEHRVRVNHASMPELMLLPGIGPTTAQRIVEHREAHGPYLRAEDLAAVSHIGPVTVERVRDFIDTTP